MVRLKRLVFTRRWWWWWRRVARLPGALVNKRQQVCPVMRGWNFSSRIFQAFSPTRVYIYALYISAATIHKTLAVRNVCNSVKVSVHLFHSGYFSLVADYQPRKYTPSTHLLWPKSSGEWNDFYMDSTKKESVSCKTRAKLNWKTKHVIIINNCFHLCNYIYQKSFKICSSTVSMKNCLNVQFKKCSL